MSDEERQAVELLEVENGTLRGILGLPKGERGSIIEMLAVLDQLNTFLAQVATERKPLLTRLVVKEREGDGEELPIVSLWAAFGEGNPIDRIDELVKENARLQAELAPSPKEKERDDTTCV